MFLRRPKTLDYAPQPPARGRARLAVGCALLACALLPLAASLYFQLKHSPMVVGIAIVGVPFQIICATAGALVLPPGRKRRTLLWFALPLLASLCTIIYFAATAEIA
jgi:hypothetical protein